MCTEVYAQDAKCGPTVVNGNPRVYNSEDSFEYVEHVVIRNTCPDSRYDVWGNIVFADEDRRVVATEKKFIAWEMVGGEFKEFIASGTKKKMYPSEVHIEGMTTEFRRL